MQEEEICTRLKNVRPFNQFLLKSCYYQQMISGYGQFGVAPELWVGNLLCLYGHDEGGLTCFETEVLSKREFEELTGVRQNIFQSSSAVVEEALRAVGSGHPYIAATDSFYSSHREDCYLKQHILHYLLVYGFNLPTRKFIVNEHLFANSPRYGEVLISFEEFERGVERYQAENPNCRKPKIVELSRVSAPKRNKSDFLDRLRELRPSIEESCANMEEGLGAMIRDCGRQEDWEAGAEKRLNFFGGVRFEKAVERNQLLFLFGDGEIVQAVDLIYENYHFLYGLTAKMMFSRQFLPKQTQSFRTRLEQIRMLERRVHHFLEGWER